MYPPSLSASWNKAKHFHSMHDCRLMVHNRCSAACRSTGSCCCPQRWCLFQEVCRAQPPTALLLPHGERGHHGRDCHGPQGCSSGGTRARLALFTKLPESSKENAFPMRNVSAQELTISWLLYQVQSQVTHPITSPHQQAVMRICMTKQKKNSARQNEHSSSSPAMHHLQGLERWANPGLQNNHLLMPVCFPMLLQGYRPGINLRGENIYKKPISLGSHFLYSLCSYFRAVGGEKENPY